MRYSIVSFTLLLAATALAAPLEKRNEGVLTKYVTKTITEIVYEPTAPAYTTQKPKPKPKPYTPPAPAPAPVVTTKKIVYSPKPTPTPEPHPEPTTTPVTQSAPESDFEKSALDTHNNLRAKHGAPALSWDYDMANFAAGHTSNCVFEHSTSDYGENIAMGFDTIQSAIQAWYDECINPGYDYEHGDFSEGTGHFTQVVWKSATKLGCGCTDCSGGKYCSCNYDTGNVIGEFQQNVLPPQ